MVDQLIIHVFSDCKISILLCVLVPRKWGSCLTTQARLYPKTGIKADRHYCNYQVCCRISGADWLSRSTVKGGILGFLLIHIYACFIFTFTILQKISLFIKVLCKIDVSRRTSEHDTWRNNLSLTFLVGHTLMFC